MGGNNTNKIEFHPGRHAKSDYKVIYYTRRKARSTRIPLILFITRREDLVRDCNTGHWVQREVSSPQITLCTPPGYVLDKPFRCLVCYYYFLFHLTLDNITNRLRSQTSRRLELVCIHLCVEEDKWPLGTAEHLPVYFTYLLYVDVNVYLWKVFCRYMLWVFVSILSCSWNWLKIGVCLPIRN